MKRAMILGGCVLGLFAIAGCSGTYRVVKKTQAGGELALVGPPESAREKANEYMTSQCSGGYDVLEEGEAVVGSTTTARTADGGKNVFGQRTSNTSADTTDKREWRIKYQCKGAAPAAPGAATPPPVTGKVQEVFIYF